MNKKRLTVTAILLIGVIILGIAVHRAYLQIYVLRDAPQYPAGIMGDMVVYTIDRETILTSLNQGTSSVFAPAHQNPIYDDVPPSWPPGSFGWNQEDHLEVADALHQFVWNEALNKWQLYSADSGILQCNDVSRIDRSAVSFYQRRGAGYYQVHNMTIDLLSLS